VRRAEKPLRLFDFWKFRRLRKASQRRHQDRLDVGRAVRVLKNLRKRQCRTQLKTLRFLPLRNADRGKESVFGWRRISGIKFQ
jgi:hypothetical protein